VGAISRGADIGRDAGQGDKPLKDLRFRCAKCGSRMTDAVMMGRGGIGVQPWRSEAGVSYRPRPGGIRKVIAPGLGLDQQGSPASRGG
jgi:hypothetical protein